MSFYNYRDYSNPIIDLISAKKNLKKLANTFRLDSLNKSVNARSELCLGLSKILANAGTPNDFVIAMENYIDYFSNGAKEIEYESRDLLISSILPCVLTHPNEIELYRGILKIYNELNEIENFKPERIIPHQQIRC